MSVEDHPKKTAVAVVTCLLIMGFLAIPSKYGEVSIRTYEIGSALYSSCNRQDSSRLEQLQIEIDSRAGDNEISTQEADWLSEILQLAQQGNWSKARTKARQLMEDQVEYP